MEKAGYRFRTSFPRSAQCVDDICVLRSCRHHSPIHAPAEFITTTGTQLGDRPSLGAWLNYGLGSENKNLPGYVVFKTGQTLRPPAIGAGFLPARYQGTLVDGKSGVPNLAMPAGVTGVQRRSQLELLHALNQKHLERHGGHTELEARIRAYELSFRMQTSAPEAFDIDSETAETRALYGVDHEDTAEYGRYLLTARRLVERGVRFIQLRSGGWDAHSDLLGNHGKKCHATDRPIAGLLKDLKRRGLLDETLVLWGGEFGRTPANQGGADKPGATIPPRAIPCGWPAAECAAARSSAPPTQSATPPSSVRSIPTTCTPPSSTPWESTSASFTSHTTTARNC